MGSAGAGEQGAGARETSGTREAAPHGAEGSRKRWLLAAAALVAVVVVVAVGVGVSVGVKPSALGLMSVGAPDNTRHSAVFAAAQNRQSTHEL